ncbi:hypothetical protein Ac2012v2_003044 [Leucoagaricus gongylophorus]
MSFSSLVIRGECKICFEDKLELHSFQATVSVKITDASKLVFYPVIVDLADSSVDYVIDGLNRMDKTCKSVSVKRAYTKLAKAAERIEEDNAERLRKAVESFAQRIIPLFEELELGRKRIQELEENQHTKFRDLTTKSRKADALEREVSHLRRSKAELENNLSESLDSVEAFRVKAEELQGNLTDARRNMSVKEEELHRAIDSLNRFKSSDILKTKKLKVFKQEVEILNTKLQEKERRVNELDNMMDLDQDHLLDTAIVAQSSTLSSLHRHSEEGWTTIDTNFQFEGMPRPGFKSAWNNNGNPGKKPNILKKLQPSLQAGPKSTIRIAQRL